MSSNEPDAAMQAEIPENANAGCVGPKSETAGKASSCQGCPNQSACASGQAKEEDPALAEVAEKLSSVRHKILVLSGKGGVGKSSFSAQLAWSLADMKKDVGILDIDICGPSIPRMMGVEGEDVHRSNSGWSPVYAADNLEVMSVGFMLSNRNDAVIWRGPRKNGLIKQFLTDVQWSPLDYLIIDAPPGTSDEHISIATYLSKTHVDGAVIITTPQEMALLDVRKEVSFCRKVKLPVIGVVENMSGFVCPCCKTKSDIFPPITGGARAMAEEMKVPFLGSIPLDPQLLADCEAGKSFGALHPNSPAAQPLSDVIKAIMQQVESSDVTVTTPSS